MISRCSPDVHIHCKQYHSDDIRFEQLLHLNEKKKKKKKDQVCCTEEYFTCTHISVNYHGRLNAKNAQGIMNRLFRYESSVCVASLMARKSIEMNVLLSCVFKDIKKKSLR